MGLLHEVQRQFIARPDESKSQIIYKWPDSNIRMFTALTVQPDEVAVFIKEGQVVGTLEAGTHKIDGADIPFLGMIIDTLTDGNVLIGELYFVSIREFAGLPFGGKLDVLEDPDTSLALQTRVFGEYSLVVTDPQQLILGLLGTGNQATNEDLSDWVKSLVLKHTRDLVATKVSEKSWDMIGIARYHSELEQELLPLVNKEVNGYGAELKRFGNISITIEDEDLDMLQKMRRDMAYAKNEGAADAALKVGVGRGMESGSSSGGDTGVGLGIGIAVGQDLINDKKKD